MDFTEFSLRILLLFTPGLVAFVIVERLTVHGEAKVHHVAVYSLLLGVGSYCLYFLVLKLLNDWLGISIEIRFASSLATRTEPLDFGEIAYVSVCAVIIGHLVSYAINHKWLFRVAQKFDITRKHGDIDVWSYTLDSNLPTWAILRDLDRDLMYEGWIQAYSDEADKRDEVLLREVKIYKNSTGEELLQMPALYLSMNRDNFLVEFPVAPITAATERSNSNQEISDERESENHISH